MRVFALIGNLDSMELVVVLIAAILIFGRRLPQVAAQAGAQLGKLRRTLDTAWKDSGADHEVREMQRSIESIRDAVPRDLSAGSVARLAANAGMRFQSYLALAFGIWIGLQAVVKGDTAAFLETARSLGDRAVIAIIDMNGNVDWDAVATALRDDQSLPPVLGFGFHTDVETRKAAKAAGVDRIVSNSQFHADMAGYVQKYRRS